VSRGFVVHTTQRTRGKAEKSSEREKRLMTVEKKGMNIYRLYFHNSSSSQKSLAGQEHGFGQEDI